MERAMDLPGIKVAITRTGAEQVLDALSSGSPITPTGGDGWSGDDMLALAGFALFGAMSQGPGAWRSREQEFTQNLEAAAQFYCRLAMMVADQEFQTVHGDGVLAMVRQSATGGVDVQVVEQPRTH
jgi:hypothetical protein